MLCFISDSFSITFSCLSEDRTYNIQNKCDLFLSKIKYDVVIFSSARLHLELKTAIAFVNLVFINATIVKQLIK